MYRALAAADRVLTALSQLPTVVDEALDGDGDDLADSDLSPTGVENGVSPAKRTRRSSRELTLEVLLSAPWSLPPLMSTGSLLPLSTTWTMLLWSSGAARLGTAGGEGSGGAVAERW